MESSDHNPPPPQEDEGDILRADSIGDTVFSKQWVFSTLMKLLKAVENEGEEQDQVNEEESRRCGIEVDEELENDLCKLWDMSANEDVAVFLQEWESPDMLINVIAKTNAPRVTEICMGVLSNMMCSSKVSEALSENKDLITLTLSLLNNRDPPTLVETCRFINTALSHPGGAVRWLAAIREDEEVFQNLAFVLQSSTNNDLIHNAAYLVDLILDSSEEMAEKWSSPPLLDGMVEAFKQARSERRATIPVILHAVQLISTTSLGIDALVKMSESILPLLAQYISDVCQEEVIVIAGKEKALTSAVYIIKALLASPEKLTKHLETDKQLLRNLLKILSATQEEGKLPASENNGTTLKSETINNADRNNMAASSEDASNPEATNNVTATEGAVSDTNMELLISSLGSFAQMVLDLSEKEAHVKELLQDKFEEGNDTTFQEKLREVLDPS